MLPGGTQLIEDLRLESEGNGYIEEVFAFPELIEPGAAEGGQAVGLLVEADGGSLLSELYNSSGEPLDGDASPFGIGGRELRLALNVGGEAVAAHFTAESTSTLADLGEALRQIAGNGATLGLERGCVLLNGEAGLDTALDGLLVEDSLGEIDFEDSFESREVRSAREAVEHVMSAQIIDASGQARQLTMVFTLQDDGAGGQEWVWEASMAEGGEVSAGGRGTLEFPEGEGASPKLRFEDGRAAMSLRGPGAASQIVEIRLGVTEGSVTQEDRGSDMAVAGNDGIESGSLEDIAIDETGTIQGIFSNGERRDLGRVALASFRNSGGLDRLRNNLYSETNDSGRPLWRGQAVDGIAARISSGALERSNVDLAQEFATMITTQQGFQANAKIVTVGDEMLIEAVELKK